MLRRILVAYNESPAARHALAEAVFLVQVEGARLIAVAVQEHPPRWDGYTLGEVREEYGRQQRACLLWLRAAEAYASDHGVRLRTEIRVGGVTQQLARAVTAYQADLLVVGCDRNPGVWGRLIGTKAERLTRRHCCPLLIASAPPRPGR